MSEPVRHRADWKGYTWHWFYRHWYDHKQAGHPVRAAVWGWLNDKVCLVLWPRFNRYGKKRF